MSAEHAGGSTGHALRAAIDAVALAYDRFLERGLRSMARGGRWWEGARPEAGAREPMREDVDRMRG